jgi:hypothetical protein
MDLPREAETDVILHDLQTRQRELEVTMAQWQVLLCIQRHRWRKLREQITWIRWYQLAEQQGLMTPRH